MVKLSILLKGIVLYVIFVIGMSIVLEYLRGSKTQLDIKIDEILDNIKNEIKLDFINKAKEHFEDVTMRGSDNMIGNPRRPLGMGYRPEYQNNQKMIIEQETDEEKIIKAVNERLKYSNMNFDNQMYANLNETNNNQNFIPLATTSDFSYTPVDYNWETNSLSNPKMNLQKYNAVNVGNHQYQFPQSNTQGLLPAKLGIDPSTYHS
jgi:hypothetical protein